MASTTRLGPVLRQSQMNLPTGPGRMLLRTVNHVKSPVRNLILSRHASLAGGIGPHVPKVTHFHVPRWLVYVLAPSTVLVYGAMRFTDPDQATSLSRKIEQGVQGKPCTKVHATDLNRWIKQHPDEIDNEHAVGWNKMYNAFTDHVRKEGEPARLEAENARQLAIYARKEDNISRSTKEHGRMSTLAANKNIGHQPTPMENLQSDMKESFADRVTARIEQAGKRFTKATKGRAFGDA